jgi:prepilin-type processing-associated H-X9-DG protein
VIAALQSCATAWSNTASASYSSMRGFSWCDGNGGWTYTNIIQTPNRDATFSGGGCRWNCAGCGIDSSFSYAVSSNHPGGANILMTDGSVRFVKDGVSRLTWWALGTRNGGEVISSDSY